MLTTQTIVAAQAGVYYTQENYYTADESEAYSQWWGEGTSRVGLEGQVKAEDFQQLLEGKLPSGEAFRHRKPTHKGYKERAGLDCTFSAPKSVSLLALVKGDRQLAKAHREAVKATLQIMEARYATTRQRRGGGIRQVVRTGNLIAAQFHHDTNRERDPHLHTHCVLINATQTADGRWYSLRNDEIVRYKKLLGATYQNELAVRVKRLGYQVESRGEGQFEVQGFAPEQLEAFSQRRQQILAQAAPDASWAERDAAWEKTRKPKGKAQLREELRAAWQERARTAGIEFPTRRRQHVELAPQPERARTAVAEAIEHCSERQTAFPVEAVERFALTEIGQFTNQELQAAVANNRDLIYVDRGVTTHQAVQRELATIRMMNEEKETHAAIAPEVADMLAGVSLTAGQREAILLASTSEDGVIGWQGVAGAGKTYALNQLKEIVVTRGHQIRGFAPSANAAKVLEGETGIESQTVARLLHSQQVPEDRRRPELWLVDEAGMLSARDAHRLLARAKAENARLLLVGDTRQNSAVEAGNPFKSLQQAGMATAYLNQSLRQKTPELEQAVGLVARGQVQRGYDVLNGAGYVRQIDLEDLAETVAADYLALPEEERQRALVIAERHVERQEIAAAIRAGLKAEGQLQEEATVTMLVSKNLTRVQERYTHHFAAGNVVVPLRDYKRLQLQKGQSYEVKAILPDGQLVLQDTEGRSYRADPAQFRKAVYQQHERAVAVGERLKWTQNDRQQERRNGEEVEVVRIEGSTAIVRNDRGAKQQIDLRRPQHLDYAWVWTTYSSQGKTANRVLMVSGPGSSKESFYVGISRAKHDLRIYTPDKTKLRERIRTSRAQENPLELLQARGQRQELLDYARTVRQFLERSGVEWPDGSRTYAGATWRLAGGPDWVEVKNAQSGQTVLRVAAGKIEAANLTDLDVQRFQKLTAAVRATGPKRSARQGLGRHR